MGTDGTALYLGKGESYSSKVVERSHSYLNAPAAHGHLAILPLHPALYGRIAL
jgi:hypothetical protein